MKKWQIYAGLGLSAAAAAVFVLARRLADKSVPEKTAQPEKAPVPTRTGSYSFISGFQNAATVEMRLDYDPERYGFAVVEEGFLSGSSDSHVALLQGEALSIQFEYASYYAGEEADGQWSAQREKHPDLSVLRFGALEAACYLEGDSVCFCLPIPEDGHSYVLATLFKAKDNDTPLADMPKDPDVEAILSSVRFERS